MGSIAEVRCHVDALADSGTAEKNGFGSRGRGLSIVVEVSSSNCCNHESVLMCVYIDQTRGNKDKRDERRERVRHGKKAALCPAVFGRNSGSRGANCDDISIYI